MEKEAQHLNPGDTFTFSPRKNAKKYQVHSGPAHGEAVEEIGGPRWKGSVPDGMKGKLLVILQNCRQVVLDKEEKVFVL